MRKEIIAITLIFSGILYAVEILVLAFRNKNKVFTPKTYFWASETMKQYWEQEKIRLKIEQRRMLLQPTLPCKK